MKSKRKAARLESRRKEYEKGPKDGTKRPGSMKK